MLCLTKEMTTDKLIAEFETFQGELKSFLLRMTASVQDSEDIVQETYLNAQAKIDSFREESSLKTWVFAIASNLARICCVPGSGGQKTSPTFAKRLP